jgi:hypothetical protein
VLAGYAFPERRALAALLAALDRLQGLPQPVLLAGAVHGTAGELDPRWASWYRRHPTQAAMAAAGRRLLPIRASAGPLLVNRRALEQGPMPRGKLAEPGQTLEWTARLLHSGAGYLVPDSRSIVRPGMNPPADARSSAALVLGAAFTGGDRLRAALELAERRRRAVSSGSR